MKNIQLKVIDIESSFYGELHALECKYALKYESLFEKRKQIVTGVYEPNDDEAKWEYDDMLDKEDEEEDISETLNEASINKSGLPEFWLQAIKSSNLLSKMMQPHDEPVLKHLSDIKIVMHEQALIGYTVEFYFNKNEFFTNQKLTKTYSLTTEKDKKDPLSYEGPVFYKCQGKEKCFTFKINYLIVTIHIFFIYFKGCVINWNRDNNVTLKLIKKKQTNKITGQVRVISKEEKQDSFFNFFETPTPDGIRPSFKVLMKGGDKVSDGEGGEDEVDEESENLYEADFEIGNFFKELLVPKALLYFTGKKLKIFYSFFTF